MPARSRNGATVDTGGSSYFQYSFERLPANATYQLYMSWLPSMATSTNAVVVVTDVFGATLLSTTVDQTVTPSDLTYLGHQYKSIYSHTIAPGDLNTSLILTLSTAGTTGAVVADAVLLARTSSDLSVTIGPSDVVTMTFPTGAIAAASGPVAAQTITLSNVVAGSLFGAFDPAVPSTGVGYNLEGEQGPCYLYSNLAYRLGSPGLGSSLGDLVLSSDANGFPLTINASVFRDTPVPLGDVRLWRRGRAWPVPSPDCGASSPPTTPPGGRCRTSIVPRTRADRAMK